MPAKTRSKPAAKKPVRGRVRAAKPKVPNVPKTNKERVRRLRRWAKIVLAVPKKRWNMGVWLQKVSGGKSRCGTAGCALGHAGLDKGFQRLGLKSSVTVETMFSEACGVVRLRGDGEGEGATALFFGLTRAEAVRVVSVYEYDGYDCFASSASDATRAITQAEVAARIIALADQYEEAGVEPARQQAPVGVEVARA